MKKVLLLTTVLLMIIVEGCGPSKEEMERREKQHADSLKNADSTSLDTQTAPLPLIKQLEMNKPDQNFTWPEIWVFTVGTDTFIGASMSDDNISIIPKPRHTPAQ